MWIPLLVGPIRGLATWAHVRWPWSALGRLRTSFVGPLDIPVVCCNPVFGDWGFPVETRLVGQTVLNCNFFLGDSIGDEKIPDIDMSCPFSTGCLPILFHFHSNLVVLIEDVVSTVSLCF
jgi:hypothetical protein